MKAFNLLALAFIFITNGFNTQIVPGQDPLTELCVVSVNLCYFFRKELSTMTRFLIAVCLLLVCLCLAPTPAAAHWGRGRGPVARVFGPRVVVVQGNGRHVPAQDFRFQGQGHHRNNAPADVFIPGLGFVGVGSGY